MPYETKPLDFFLDIVAQNMPDLIFLQIDPMPYLFRQRYMAQKCALQELEEYEVNALEDFQNPVILSWEEAVVNLIVVDMLRANNTHMKLDYTKGVCTYAYPDLQDERTHDNLKERFIESITNHIICD